MSNSVYLTAPYVLKNKRKEFGANSPNNDIEEKELRFKKFCKVASKLVNNGYFIGSGIPLAHSVSGLAKIPDFVNGFELKLMPYFDMVMVICLEGWRECEYLKKEINYAKENKLLVIYISEDLEILGCTC